MTLLKMKHLIVYSLCIVVSLLTSCKKEEPPKAKVPVNNFSMQVNGQEWKPFQSEENPCYSTYTSGYAHLGEIPLITFYAYRDLKGRADADSQNLLRMRVMNVTEPGIYLLDGTYKEDFDSYVIFQMQQADGEPRRYINMPKRYPFVVNVDEIAPKKGYTIPGTKGTFAGVLYNEADPSDSLVIKRGKFAFDVLTAGFQYHCGY